MPQGLVVAVPTGPHSQAGLHLRGRVERPVLDDLRVLPRLVKQRPVRREADRSEELTTSSRLARIRSSSVPQSLSCTAGPDEQGGEVPGDVSHEIPLQGLG